MKKYTQYLSRIGPIHIERHVSCIKYFYWWIKSYNRLIESVIEVFSVTVVYFSKHKIYEHF